jgi:hypothetical protein
MFILQIRYIYFIDLWVWCIPGGMWFEAKGAAVASSEGGSLPNVWWFWYMDVAMFW